VSDATHFLEVTLPYQDVVWSVARRMSVNRERAEDLVQETYLRAFRGFGNKADGDIRSWLVAICLNAARSEARRARRRPVEVHDTALVGTPSPADVCEDALSSVARAAVAAALGQLPAPQRVAIVLMDIGGLSAREAAEMLGVPRGTVLARVHRGRRKLAELLEREGARDGP
jgi:RNA polymerase sigma-70 factor (ECF subfamily)